MTEAASSTSDYEFIDTPAHLERWVGQMHRWLESSSDKRCCLDTEADSLHHYHEKLCLLQVNCAGRFALVDPLAVSDVSPLLELLDAHELWFHGADYDLTMLRRSYSWSPRQVRDTQIAARLLGARQFGLAALVKNHFEIELCKASQKADWSRRPLPSNMLSYAVDDVRYLLPLAEKFVEQLTGKGRLAWFQQSCLTLQQDVAARDHVIREDPWRVQGSGRLHPRGLAILKSMWEWRDGIAKERDVPCFKIMSNKQMTAYAEHFEAEQSLTPPNGWRPRWKKEFHDIVVAVGSSDAATWPTRPKKAKGRLSEAQRAHIDKLCEHRESVATKLEIEPSLLGSRGTIEELVVDGDPSLHLMAWQQDLLAEGLREVLKAD